MRKLLTPLVFASLLLVLALGHASHALAAGNLVHNPGAETASFTGWNVSNGGSGWAISGLNHSGSYSFISSYEWGTLSQELDLLSEGYTAAVLDAQPTIDASSWVMGYDSGSGTDDPYQFKVILRDASHNPIATYDTGEQTATGSWAQLAHTFTSYGAGVRYIYVELRGKDSAWWLGQFGSAFDDTSVTIAGETTPPTVSTLSPTDGNTAFSSAGNLALTFSEAVTVGSGNLVIYRTSDNSTVATIGVTSGQVTGSGSTTITVNPTSNLTPGVDYYVQIPSTAFHDGFANYFPGVADTTTWNFRTYHSSGTALTTVAKDYGITSLVAGDDVSSAVNLTWKNGADVSFNRLLTSSDAGATWTEVPGYFHAESYSWTVPADMQGQSVSFKVISTDLSNELGSATLGPIVVGPVTDPLSANSTSDGADVAEDDASDVSSDDASSTPTMGRSPYNGEIEEIDAVGAGDYIRGEHYDTVYVVDALGRRHPFVNQQIFFSWEPSFEVVKTVTDATLQTLTISTPALPRSGVVLVKVQSSPLVYAVTTDDDGTTVLQVVPGETAAKALYGDDWSDYVIDLPPTTFAYFSMGSDLTGTEQLDRSMMKKRAALTEM